LARRRRFGKPVKVAIERHTPATFRAKPGVALSDGKRQPRLSVKKAMPRTKRFGRQPVKHSLPLARD